MFVVKRISKLICVGGFSGVILILVLKVVQILTGNDAYVLLFNFDYIPLIKNLRPVLLFGYLFHFITCIISVIILYYILRIIHIENRISLYLFVFAIGGGILFTLTALSNQPPAVDDLFAWIYWTFGHAVFGFVVGFLVKKWV